jgi:hypothetical protein
VIGATGSHLEHHALQDFLREVSPEAGVV